MNPSPVARSTVPSEATGIPANPFDRLFIQQDEPGRIWLTGQTLAELYAQIKEQRNRQPRKKRT